jgi:anti-anti-sigma factor
LLAAAGLHALLEQQDRYTRSGGQLVAAAPSAPVRRVLCVTGLEKALPVMASVEDAVALVAAAATRANR